MPKRKPSVSELVNNKGSCDLINNFKQGDLIFGMHGPMRTQLISELSEKKFTDVFANTLNCPTVGLVINDSKNLSSLNNNQKKHHQFLMGLKNYLLKPNGTPVPLMENTPVEGAAYRRACKSLVRHAKAKRRIHFDLTRIDIKRVCKKNKADTGVANSELRAAFRQFKMKKRENPNLLFYHNGRSCQPPWKQAEHKSDWEAYQSSRVKKKSTI